MPGGGSDASGRRWEVYHERHHWPTKGDVNPPGESLHRHAADLDGLLVLDNCEHVAAAAGELAYEPLQAAPRLRLLATSREVLRVPGEMTWQVPALPEADAVWAPHSWSPKRTAPLGTTGPQADNSRSRPSIRNPGHHQARGTA